MLTNDELQARLEEFARDPLKAADELDRLAEQFAVAATELRRRAASGGAPGGIVSVGGVGDRARVNVVGPNGELKQQGGVG